MAFLPQPLSYIASGYGRNAIASYLFVLLFNSYLLACTYAATTDFIELLELANGGAVAACYLREGVALTDSDVASSAVSLLLVS